MQKESLHLLGKLSVVDTPAVEQLETTESRDERIVKVNGEIGSFDNFESISVIDLQAIDTEYFRVDVLRICASGIVQINKLSLISTEQLNLLDEVGCSVGIMKDGILVSLIEGTNRVFDREGVIVG